MSKVNKWMYTDSWARRPLRCNGNTEQDLALLMELGSRAFLTLTRENRPS